MANNPFNTYTTTPGLGATDLANHIGAGFMVGFGNGFRGETRPKAKGSLKGLLRKLATLRPGARSTR